MLLFYYVDEIDATALVEMRKQLKPVAAHMVLKLHICLLL